MKKKTRAKKGKARVAARSGKKKVGKNAVAAAITNGRGKMRQKIVPLDKYQDEAIAPGSKTLIGSGPARIVPGDFEPHNGKVPAKTAPLPEPRRMMIAVDAIDDSDKGGRGPTSDRFKAEIAELAGTIGATGMLQPIGVIELNGKAKGGKKYALAWGFRRTLAHKHLERAKIDAFVFPHSCEDRLEEVRGIENVQRSELDLIDQALLASKLYAETPCDATGNASHSARCRAVGEKLGKSESWVGDRVYLARLSGEARELVRSGRLPLQQAREIATIADPSVRNDLAEQCARREDGSGGESYERVAQFCREVRRSLKVVPWRLSVAFAGAPACDKCPSNTANDLGLWGHRPAEAKLVAENGPFCMNEGCFERKQRAAEASIVAGVKRVDAAIKAKKLAKGELNKTTLEAAGIMPESVKETTFVRKVKQEFEPGAKPSVRKGQGVMTQRMESPEEKSRRRLLEQHEQACRKWYQDAKNAIRGSLNTPSRRLYARLLVDSALFEQAKTWGYNNKPAATMEKALASPKLATMLSKLADPAAADILELVPARLEEHHLHNFLGDWNCREHEEHRLADALAKSLGVTLKAFPTMSKETAVAKAAVKGTEVELDQSDDEGPDPEAE